MLRGAADTTPPLGTLPRRRDEAHLTNPHVAATGGGGEVWESLKGP